MSRTLSSPFFSATPVFTRADYARAVGRAPADKTVTAMLSQHVKAGNIKRIARGLYASVPKHADAATWWVDRFLLASRLRPEAVIGYHSALELHGYADGRMGYLHQVPILKQIAAGEGDVVCTRAGALSINGRWRAPVFVHDPRGATLPQWRGCRALLKGEFFVFSNRIPNSFDSRYYGPVKVDQIMGVFEPVATTTSHHGDA
jgi:hypothetical protein